jgi:molecular chaperone DnaJ
MTVTDAHQVLGVPIGASPELIKRAYRKAARQYHPDVNKSPDATRRMSDVNLAHATLLSLGSAIPGDPFEVLFNGLFSQLLGVLSESDPDLARLVKKYFTDGGPFSGRPRPRSKPKPSQVIAGVQRKKRAGPRRKVAV